MTHQIKNVIECSYWIVQPVLLFLFLNNTSYAGPIKKHLQKICDQVSLLTFEDIDFTDSEKRLLCGDPTNEAWRKIPPSQSLFSLRAFLQDRGFYQLNVITRSPSLLVELESPAVVKKTIWKGVPEGIDLTRLRHIVLSRLTPKFLDEVKSRTEQMLRNEGFPCATVTVTADPNTETLELNIESGSLRQFGEISSMPIPGLESYILRRSDAFKTGQLYNDDLLTLTSRRIVEAGLVQSAYFSPVCSPEMTATKVKQTLIAGAPRNLTLGLGLDTEQYVRMRTSWQHFRLGTMGSKVEVKSILSVRSQEVSSQLNWYYLPFSTHHYLAPILLFKHNNETIYESIEGQLALTPTLKWDSDSYGYLATLGPALNFEHQYKPLVAEAYSASLYATFRMTTHDFEFYQASPRSGFTLGLAMNMSQQGIFSNITAQKIELTFQKLWNASSLEPPAIILGVRGGFSTTLVPSQMANLKALPAGFKSYLGGASNIRGFDRNKLTGLTGDGSLTSAFMSLEGRLYDLIPWGFQPFLFFDLAALGDNPVNISPPFYFAPGFGTRWESPIGSFRFSVGHGYLVGDPKTINPKLATWHSFLGYGEEF